MGARTYDNFLVAGLVTMSLAEALRTTRVLVILVTSMFRLRIPSMVQRVHLVANVVSATFLLFIIITKAYKVTEQGLVLNSKIHTRLN